MMVPFHKHELSAADKAAVMAVLDSDYLTQGPQVRAFEDALCEYTGAKYAVAVSSGTAALYCAYMAADCHLAHVPANTFVATRNAALAAGRVLVIQDVDPDTGRLPEDRGGCDRVPVDFAGVRCEVLGSGQVRDAAHSLELYKDWDDEHNETLCFSFHPCKAVACGEGGAVVTNNPDVAYSCQATRDNGREVGGGFACTYPGALNLRMDEMSAALGVSQLKTVGDRLEQRQHIVSKYSDAFGEIGYQHPESSACHLYPIRIAMPKFTSVTYEKYGIGTRRHYPPLEDLPGAVEWYQNHLSLPLYPTMVYAEVAHVIETVKRIEGL